MNELVERLAELTGQRDRDVLDVTLVNSIRELLGCESVAIHRSVGEIGSERWITRARLAGYEPAARADSAWTDLDELPLLAAFPARVAAMRSEQLVHVDGATHLDIFPISTDREVVGVLEIETRGGLDISQQRMIGSILRIYRNFHGLLDYSERDTLTGLLNRKTFDDSFLKATASRPLPLGVSADERRGSSDVGYWLGVIDIDHFKRVNDNYGHLIGDEVLLLISRLMRGSFRYHDRLYRFGGEEFVVLMRCRGDPAAALALERLRANTERYTFPQVGRITVSIGFTGVKAGDTPSGAFERADKSVYHAKQNGRNQVASHAELVARGIFEDGSKVGDVELF